jgi:hypothetical protein
MMKGKHAQARMDVLLSAYLDGELRPEEQAWLESRLAADQDLRARLEALRRTVALVQGLPQIQAPRNFLLTPAMVARAQPRPASRRWLAPALTFATAASALSCVVVLMAGLLVFGTRGMGTTAPAAPAYELAAEEEQVVETEAPAEPALEETVVELVGAPEEAERAEGETQLETPWAGGEAPPAEEAPPATATAVNLAPADEAAGTAVPSEPPARSQEPTATATLPLAPGLGDDVAVTEVAPSPAVEPGEPTPTPPSAPAEQETAFSFSTTLWFLAGGLVLLTAGLAVGAGLAWRARRR